MPKKQPPSESEQSRQERRERLQGIKKYAQANETEIREHFLNIETRTYCKTKDWESLRLSYLLFGRWLEQNAAS